MSGALVITDAPAASAGTMLDLLGGHVLWCADCGRSAPCPIEDVLRYAESAWPRCCGEVMSLGTPAWVAIRRSAPGSRPLAPDDPARAARPG